jgi:aspartate kinase
MHPRAVEIAARFNVPICVLSSFRDTEVIGTLITRRTDMEELVLAGLASQGGFARLVIRAVPASMDAMARLLTALAERAVSVDFFGFADADAGDDAAARPGAEAGAVERQLQLTIPEADIDTATAVCRSVLNPGARIEVHAGLSRVTLVGGGMAGVPGVYARAVESLHSGGIDVYAFSTSAMTISVLVDAEKEERTLQLLHTAFDLAKVG